MRDISLEARRPGQGGNKEKTKVRVRLSDKLGSQDSEKKSTRRTHYLPYTWVSLCKTKLYSSLSPKAIRMSGKSTITACRYNIQQF